MNLVCIRNDSLQTLEVYFRGPQGLKPMLMFPGDVRSVDKNMITQHIQNLIRRRMLSTFNYN